MAGWKSEGSRWYGDYYVYVKDEAGKETRRHVGVGLGDKATLRKWEAKAKLAGIIKSITKRDPRADDQTLRWYVEEKFLPMMLPTWAPSTRETNKYHAELLLAEREYSFTVIDHCRTLLRVILEEAVEAELVGKNVARKLAVPELPKTVKPVIDPKDARALFDALPFRDRLITMIAAFCALRPENWLRRRIKPVAKKLGITVPVHFQILRRTFATQAQGLGPPKDLQTHLRHSTIATAQEHYVQPVEASTRRLVNRVAQSVMKQ